MKNPDHMSEFQIKQATRQGVIPLIELWGGTGGGKTESALRLARGLAGPDGKVVIIDTEHGRARYCVDRIPGGYKSIDFEAPFTPERYVEAMTVAENGAAVCVLDSATHLWEGDEGILDLHEQALDKMTKGSTDWKERERLNWPAWREPKQLYKKFRNKALGFKIPLIICCRGEEKTHMEKGENNRNVIVTDKTTTPVFDKKFVFETHIALEVYQIEGRGGYIRFTPPFAKVSHELIRRILPEPGKQQLTIQHGEALAQWCASAGSPAAVSTPSSTTTPPKSATGTPEAKGLKEFEVELWQLLRPVRKPGVKSWQDSGALQWLWDESVISDTEFIPGPSEARMIEIIRIAKEKLHV